jgi:hypothetical protein
MHRRCHRFPAAMLDASAQRILDALPPDALLLDVGGGVKPFNRADWIMDALPYEERGSQGSIGPEPERFTAASWARGDFCARDPWPFADKQFDFALCSHTLEDVRDPIWMCSELNRVARAGYIEVPSRLEEQTYGFQGPWTGWSHHRWLIDVDAERSHITFVHKSSVVERDDSHFPPEFRNGLRPEERVSTLWWEGSFEFGERLFWDPIEFDAWLSAPLRARELPRGGSRRSARGLRRRLGR